MNLRPAQRRGSVDATGDDRKKDQILPDNPDEAIKVVKEFLFCRISALPLKVFEQLVGRSVEECDRFEIGHYPESRIFKEMWFVWLDESRCIQLDTSQSDQL